MFGFFLYTFWVAFIFVQNKKINPKTGNEYKIDEIIAINQGILMGMMQFMVILPNLQTLSKAGVVGKKVFDIIER